MQTARHDQLLNINKPAWKTVERTKFTTIGSCENCYLTGIAHHEPRCRLGVHKWGLYVVFVVLVVVRQVVMTPVVNEKDNDMGWRSHWRRCKLCCSYQP